MRFISKLLGIALATSVLNGGIVNDPNLKTSTVIPTNAPLHVFNDALGLSYEGEGWDIGAFQYKPGKDIGVPLLFNVSSPPFLAFQRRPDKPTNLRMILGSENYIASNVRQSTKSDPLITQINSKLDKFARYAITNAESPVFGGLRDIIDEQSMIKMFLISSGQHYGFYYNGTLGGRRIKIADTTLTQGLTDREYLKIVSQVPLSTNLVRETFPQLTNSVRYPILKDGKGLIRFLLNPSVTTALRFDYSGDVENIAGSAQAFNSKLADHIERGITLSPDLMDKVNVTKEEIYHGQDGNELYNQTLDLILNHYHIQ